MPFTFDPATDLGKVRLLISDTDSSNPIFSDDSYIQAFLDLNGSDVRLAAATALRSIAANQVMVLKVIQILDLKTDGAATAKALMQAADAYTKESEGSADWAGFDWAEQVDNSQFALNEYLTKLLIAGGY